MRREIGTWLLAALAVGGVGALYGWKGGKSLLFLLLLLLLVVLQGVCAQCLGPKRVKVVRTWLPQYPRAGEMVEVRLNITLSGGFLPMWLQVEDGWWASVQAGQRKVGEPHGGKLVFGGWRREFSGTYFMKETHRGIYYGDPVTITWGDLFGWFQRSLRAEANDALVIHPAPLDVLPATLDYRKRDAEGDESGRDAVLQGERDTGRLRTYEPGDPLRRIHWKSSAKKGSLLTRVPDERKSLSRCLILDIAADSYPKDGRQAGNDAAGLRGSIGGFELAVRAAASWLVRELERSGEMVFRHSGMREPVSPGAYTLSGNSGLKAGLDLLAEAAPTMDASLSAAGLLRSAMESASDRTLTLITGCLTPELAEAAVHFAEQGAALELWCAYGAEESMETVRLAELLRQNGVSLVGLTNYGEAKTIPWEGGAGYVIA